MKALSFTIRIIALLVAVGLTYLGIQKLSGLTNESITLLTTPQSAVYSLASQDFIFEFNIQNSGSKSLYITTKDDKTVSINIDRVSEGNLGLMLKSYWQELGSGTHGGKVYNPTAECKYVQLYFILGGLIEPGSDNLEVDRIDCREILIGQDLEDI